MSHQLHAIACTSIHATTFKQQPESRDNFYAMNTDDWRSRLMEAVQRDGRSMRAISIAAGHGPNYLQQVLRDQKDPGFGRVARILDVMGTSTMLYVISGTEITDEDAEMLRIVLSLPPTVRSEARDLFRAIQAREELPEPPPSDPT